MKPDKAIIHEPDLELYKPFQRLDFVHFKSLKSVCVRARLFVLLHENESIKSPAKVKTDKLYHSETLFVAGDATGPLRLCRIEYVIEFIRNLKGDDEPFVRNAIKTRLEENLLNVFIVNTKVTKNPTEQATNTISQDGDIEIRR